MRVAILSYNAQTSDALGNQVAEKLAFFLDRGADVRVFLESERRLQTAVRRYCHVLGWPEMPHDSWEFLSSADLILIEYGQYYRLLEWLPLLAGGKPRLLFDYHGVTPVEFWGTGNREALENGIRRRGLVWCCDAALVHSRFSCDELCSQTAFPSEHIFVLDYPVDTSRFCRGSPRRHLFARLGLQDVSLLLFVGRLAPNKRVPILLEALDRLRDRQPPIHIALVGDTTDVYEAEVQRCRQRAVELGLANRVHFLGQVGDRELLDAYRSADLFVMPSRHEGFCIPVIEAMACGLPVVAARAGALPETVGDAGLTFTSDDPDDLARQVQRVLDNGKDVYPSVLPAASLVAQMRRQGLRRAADHARRLWRDRFGQVMEDLLHRPPRPKRDQVEVRPRTSRRAVTLGSATLLVPVRVFNGGTHAVLSEGPGRIKLSSLVLDERGQICNQPALETPLPDLLAPGQEVATMMRVPVPACVGTYHVALFAVAPSFRSLDSPFSSDAPARGLQPQPDAPARTAQVDGVGAPEQSWQVDLSKISSHQLMVEPANGSAENPGCAESLQAVHRALAEAEGKQELPTDYLDVTDGFLAKLKRWLKNKLLGNFKHAYVDILSRQQSAFNQQTLIALQELAECCALLNHALARQDSGESSQPTNQYPVRDSAVKPENTPELDLLHQLEEARRRLTEMEARLTRLEAPHKVVNGGVVSGV